MATQAVESLTRVRYVGQDFQTYVNEITDFFQGHLP